MRLDNKIEELVGDKECKKGNQEWKGNKGNLKKKERSKKKGKEG